MKSGWGHHGTRKTAVQECYMLFSAEGLPVPGLQPGHRTGSQREQAMTVHRLVEKMDSPSERATLAEDI